MTQKDYELLARVHGSALAVALSVERDETVVVLNHYLDSLVAALSAENPRFSAYRFRTAVDQAAFDWIKKYGP